MSLLQVRAYKRLKLDGIRKEKVHEHKVVPVHVQM